MMSRSVNFVIAGSARSGTTALAAALSTHPEIFFTSPKETHFFSHAGIPVEYRGPGDDLLINDVAITDPHQFADLFADVGAQHTRCGEGSVTSLFFYERSIAALEQYADPDVRVILLLREPHARMMSGFSYMRSRGHEDALTLEDALMLERERQAAGWCHMWAYEEVSRYGDQVAAFHEAFGDRLHIGIYEHFRRDPAAELASLCRFLAIDPTFRFDAVPETNRGGEPRSVVLTNALNKLRASSTAADIVRRVIPLRAREAVRRSTLKTPEPATRSADIDFSGDVRTVEAILGCEIEDWQ